MFYAFDAFSSLQLHGNSATQTLDMLLCVKAEDELHGKLEIRPRFLRIGLH